METKILVAIITSSLALIASVFATVFSYASQKRLKILEAEYRARAESAEFLAAKLDRFYLPIAMHLSTTKKLFDRFFAAGEAEKRAIEHELREHNSKVRESLMNASIYIEPDAPEARIEQLLEHLVQWEIVYKLKYEYKVYEGPVFAGIDKFGFRGFPKKEEKDNEGIDEYFRRKVKELKTRHHERLELNT